MTAKLVIGLSAVIVAIREDGEAAALTVRPSPGELAALPFGPFDPQGQRTFELALRAFVGEQTGFDLGYVEQLYTFGDRGREAPLADVGAGDARVVSVGYLALTPKAVGIEAPGSGWTAWPRFFPWEDWRKGRPALLDEALGPALLAWAAGARGAPAQQQRRTRAALLFGLDGAPWNEERVLERYELLYDAGLVAEAARDAGKTPDDLPPAAFGEPMMSDHRRILATALSRLRGKLKYRPVIFELMPPEFTLFRLQRAVEAIVGVPLHKQNFRRGLERTGLVEGLGRMDATSGGRPAELFRFRRELTGALPLSGLSLPVLREG
ncbi:MAG: NUDIX hydrolase [Caulobacteraceae bacterium]